MSALDAAFPAPVGSRGWAERITPPERYSMPPFVSTIEIEITRPPAEVFAYVTDPRHFPEWQRDVVRVHIEGDGQPTAGSRFTTIRKISGIQRRHRPWACPRGIPRDRGDRRTRSCRWSHEDVDR